MKNVPPIQQPIFPQLSLFPFQLSQQALSTMRKAFESTKQLAMLALTVLVTALSVSAQLGTQYPGSNLLAKTYPNEITARYNSSVWFLPAPKAAVEALLPAGLKLLPSHPVPGLAPDEWPLTLQAGLDSEIKQYGLTIGDFYDSRLAVPWVDKSNDGVTPFAFHYHAVVSASVPAVLGSIVFGEHVLVGTYKPDRFVFRKLAGGVLAEDAAKVGGEQLFSIRARNTRASSTKHKYTLDLFKDFANQGYVNYAKDSTYHATTYALPLTQPTFITGNVTLGRDLVPAALAKTYVNVQGLRAAEHFVETLNQPCKGRATFPSSSR